MNSFSKFQVMLLWNTLTVLNRIPVTIVTGNSIWQTQNQVKKNILILLRYINKKNLQTLLLEQLIITKSMHHEIRQISLPKKLLFDILKVTTFPVTKQQSPCNSLINVCLVPCNYRFFKAFAIGTFLID